LFFIGLLGMIISIANLYQQSTTLYGLQDCYKLAINNTDVGNCKTNFYQTTNVALQINSRYPSPNQRIIILFKPIIDILLWIVLSLFGILLFNFGNHFLRLSKKEFFRKKEINSISKVSKKTNNIKKKKN